MVHNAGGDFFAQVRASLPRRHHTCGRGAVRCHSTCGCGVVPTMQRVCHRGPEPPILLVVAADVVVIHGARLCVCVYLSSGFKGQCFNYAIPIAKSFPPMTSLPYLGLVVLPLQTPRGIWREGFPTSPCILVGTPWQLLGGSSTT